MFWLALPNFFQGGTFSRIPLSPVLISISLWFVHFIVQERKLWCSRRDNHCTPPHTYLVGGMWLFICVASELLHALSFICQRLHLHKFKAFQYPWMGNHIISLLIINQWHFKIFMFLPTAGSYLGFESNLFFQLPILGIRNSMWE